MDHMHTLLRVFTVSTFCNMASYQCAYSKKYPKLIVPKYLSDLTRLIVNHLALAVKVVIAAGRGGVLQGGVGEGGAKVVRRVGVLIVVGVDSIVFF